MLAGITNYIPNKEEYYKFDCLYTYYNMICIICTSFFLTPFIYQKAVLYQHADTNCFGKCILCIQILAYIWVTLSSIYLLKIDNLTDCLINMSVLLILAEFYKLFGGLFKMHLEAYHEEIAENDQFMVIKSKKEAK